MEIPNHPEGKRPGRAKILLLSLLSIGLLNWALANNSIKSFQGSPSTIKKEEEKAFSYKILGDYYVSKANFKKAASHYLKALNIGRKFFTGEEKIEMAKYISWGERPDEAVEELSWILSEDPNNLKARILYARSLSWAGRLDEALKEASLVLKSSPEDEKALLIKADVLNWQGNHKTAIRIYKNLLEREETFEAQLGLTYALLSIGDIKGAKENRKYLKPVYSYQEQELEKLKAKIIEKETLSPVSFPKSKNERAISFKKLGDDYVSKEDYKKAASHYLKALDLGRKFFTEEEKIKIAKYIAWGERPGEAAEELNLILSENPEHLEARLLYARTLSWAGRLNETLKETDRILKNSPENKEARLIKADALRWKGEYKIAILLYKKLLEREEAFEARLGLTYALLATGDIKSAKESKTYLKPRYPYQERELEKLNRAVEERTQSSLEMNSRYYSDTENNQVEKYWFSYGRWAGKWKLDFSFKHTNARDNTSESRAEDFTFSLHSRVTSSLNVGGSLGLTRLSNGKSRNYMIGQTKADLSLFNGTLGAYITREAYTITAQLIENKVRITNMGAYFSQSLTNRLFLYISYSHRDYSDKNKSSNLVFSLSQAFLTRIPSLSLGYRFDYLDFERQTGKGYFDPQDYFSHQIFMVVFVQKEGLYLYLRPFFGHQSFHRFAAKTEDFFTGGYGTLRFGLKRNLLLEIHAEGGNYALAMAPGWRYFLIRGGLVYRF